MKVEDFYRFITPELPGCPDELMRQAVMLTANQFCIDTQVLDVFSDPIDLIDGQADYDMDILPGCQAITIKNVWTQTRELTPASMSEVQRLIPNWQSARNSQPMLYNMAKGFGTLTVYPTPAEPISAKLTFRAVYAANQGGNVIPDMLIDRYFDALACGAKGRLMIMANKTWSNPQQGVIYNQWYANETIQAKIDVMHDRVPGSLRVQPIAFR